MENIDSTSTLSASGEDLSPLEQDVLDEYERLAENMKKVTNSLSISLAYNLVERAQADICRAVGESARYNGEQTDSRDRWRAKTAGTKDKLGFHALES